MGKLLTLTSLSGHATYVMSSAMGGFSGVITKAGKHASVLYIDGQSVWVKETPQEIFKLIEDAFKDEE